MFENKNVSRRGLLRRVRDRLVERARRRNSGVFTADDIHTVLDSTRFRGNRQSVIATLLNDSSPTFYTTGDEVPSQRPVARRRLIHEWSV